MNKPCFVDLCIGSVKAGMTVGVMCHLEHFLVHCLWYAELFPVVCIVDII